MKEYKSLEELEEDLEYARKNPYDLEFFNDMLARYENSSEELQKKLKASLLNSMLEYNPTFLIEKVAEENPTKIIYCNTQENPFFTV